MSTQTPAERNALNAAWRAQPKVIAFTAAVEAHVAASGHLTGLDGMNATIAFANAWIAANGDLPDSGIACN